MEYLNSEISLDVIKWKHFPRYWRFVCGIHRSPVISPHKGQWRGALVFSLICAWMNGWVNNRGAGEFIRHSAHYDIAVMYCEFLVHPLPQQLRKYNEQAKAMPFAKVICSTSDVYAICSSDSIDKWDLAGPKYKTILIVAKNKYWVSRFQIYRY